MSRDGSQGIEVCALPSRLSLQYTNTKGIVWRRNFASLVFHFFNHQTHHRGQATTLLSQAGQDVGVTDLLALIPNEALQEVPAGVARESGTKL